jgi:shikimate dehydrogenase
MSEAEKYAVIGHPIAHSKSPVIQKVFAEQTGENISYEAIDAAPEELHNAVTRFIALGGRGLNVTVPHKQAIIELMDTLTERAELAGAVNTVSKLDDGSLCGDNTDGIGLIIDLRDNLELDLENMRILVLGAGGAARGILATLAELRPDELVIANRTLERALDIVDEFADIGRIKARSFEELAQAGLDETEDDVEIDDVEIDDVEIDDVEIDDSEIDDEIENADDDAIVDIEDEPGPAFDLVINATSAGLEGEVPPFPACIIGPDTVCYDLSYSMRETPFVLWAKAQGCKAAHQGWGMLIEQAAESFNIWRDIRPDTTNVRKQLPS